MFTGNTKSVFPDIQTGGKIVMNVARCVKRKGKNGKKENTENAEKPQEVKTDPGEENKPE